MSAPPLFRLVDERRVSVVHDAAAVRQLLDEDPVGSCMVASRVADHGVEPSAIGGELWTRRNSGGADMETLSELSREAVTPLSGSCSAYGHNRRTAGICSALFSDSQCLFDQRLDDLRLRHGLD